MRYRPPASIKPFLTSKKFISLIVGPVGSTKTTASMMKIIYHAKRMAACSDGIRRSRAVWVRNTREQLRDSSIPDFLKLFPPGVAGDYGKTEYRFTLRFDDVECEVWFRGLDDANDVRRLLSVQTSFIIFDEFREQDQAIFEQAQARTGRYPDKTMVPPRPEWGVDEKGNPIGGCVADDGSPNKHVWGASNPPDLDTYWERLLTAPPENTAVFFQPSALSPEADWIEYLPTNYYEDLVEGKSQDWIDVYVHAKFGKSLSGFPVFRTFSRELHVAKESFAFNRASANPLIVGFDVGLHPGAVFCQLDYANRLLVYAAISQAGMGAQRFFREHVKPILVNRFMGAKVIVVGDPVGDTRSPTDERTVFQIVRNEGLTVRPAPTNLISPRLAAVEHFLTRLTPDGKPALLIDPVHAQPLIQALAGKYRFRVRKDGQPEDLPEKLHPWSDIADSLQYACLHAAGGAVVGAKFSSGQRQDVRPVSYIYA